MHDGAAEAFLLTVEPVSAPAPGRQMIKAGRDLLRRRELTSLALMTRLTARLAQRRLRALAGQRAALLTRQRRILRRRQRAIRRVTTYAPLELLDTLKQRRYLRDLL
jgi:hypothetical protein